MARYVGLHTLPGFTREMLGAATPALGEFISPTFIKALAEVRSLAAREGWCYLHVQAITVAIDQYAEKALGNREYFLNKPYSIGGSKSDVPWLRCAALEAAPPAKQ